MCPWPRFQGAMLDQDSLVVTYRNWRGEPRGKPKDLGSGDCVDCGACVHVCPTGIDIREGQQLECIGCGLCVDACNDIMRKLSRPQGLIAFEALSNLAASTAAAAPLDPGPARFQAGMAARRPLKLLRPRTLMYAGVLATVVAVMLGGFLLRDTLTLTALAERAPPFVRLSDGGIRNAYTLKLADKTRDGGRYALVLDGPAGLRLVVQDAAVDAAGRPVLPVRRDGVASYRALVTAPRELHLGESQPLRFRLVDEAGQVVASGSSVFLGPHK